MGQRALKPRGYIVLWLLAAGAIFCLFGPAVFAEDSQDAEQYPGYLSDVSNERTDTSKEFVIMPLAEPANQTKLVDKIFTEKLKKDFVNEYRREFGYTEYEQVEFTSNRFVDVQGDDSGRLTPVNEYIDTQKKFGSYMIKAMIDYHADNYLKNSHDMKKVYETKQKLQNIEYKTESGQKLKMKYNLASNTATFSLEKPEERFHKSLDVQVFTSPNTIAHASYDLTKVLNLESNYAIENEIVSLILSKQLRPNLRATLTGQTFQKDIDVDTPKQNRGLVGLSWND